MTEHKSIEEIKDGVPMYVNKEGKFTDKDGIVLTDNYDTDRVIAFASLKTLEDAITKLNPNQVVMIGYVDYNGDIQRWNPQMDKYGNLKISPHLNSRNLLERFVEYLRRKDTGNAGQRFRTNWTIKGLESELDEFIESELGK